MREEIIKLLDQYRLKEALSQMTGYATHTSDWQLKNELEALQNVIRPDAAIYFKRDERSQ